MTTRPTDRTVLSYESGGRSPRSVSVREGNEMTSPKGARRRAARFPAEPVFPRSSAPRVRPGVLRRARTTCVGFSASLRPRPRPLGDQIDRPSLGANRDRPQRTDANRPPHFPTDLWPAASLPSAERNSNREPDLSNCRSPDRLGSRVSRSRPIHSCRAILYSHTGNLRSIMSESKRKNAIVSFQAKYGT